MGYSSEVIAHYGKVWKNYGTQKFWNKGPVEHLNHDFCVLEFPPTKSRKVWTYATCCMSDNHCESPIELHVFSSKQDESILELLTSVAYYHKNDHKINLNHTINFGRPWQDNSICDHGFISLPYLDGPVLENGEITGCKSIVKFYWLIPITKQEVDFKIKYGSESLEEKLEHCGFDYINPTRQSVV